MIKVLSMKPKNNRIIRNYIGLVTLVAVLLSSCNVHEWPKEQEEVYPFVLNMDFDMELPLHKELFYSRDGFEEETSRYGDDAFDIRYKVNVYSVTDQNDENRNVVYSYIFTQPYVENHNFQVLLNLPEGNYRFRVWSDHVLSGTREDHFYQTDDFAGIKLNQNNGHNGSNEFRDAFSGSAYGEVYDPEIYKLQKGEYPDNSATALMKRPMGRYEFVSTDMDDFLNKAIQNMEAAKLAALLAKAASRTVDDTKGEDTKGEIFWNGLTRDEVAEAIGLGDYTVVFSYNAYMPDSYNLFADKTSDSSSGIFYESGLKIGDEGIILGFDYIIVEKETIMNINMSIYNGEDILVASTSRVEVPVARSKNTVVKGSFLTVSNGGGVAIDPGFDGDDFNIKVGY